jgi:hypothetical protein
MERAMRAGLCPPSHLPVAGSGSGNRLPASPGAVVQPAGRSVSSACRILAGVTACWIPGLPARPVRRRVRALHPLPATRERLPRGGFAPRPWRAVPQGIWTKMRGPGKFRPGHSPGGPGRNREQDPHLGRSSAPQPVPRLDPATLSLTIGFSSWRKYPTGGAGGVKPPAAMVRPGRTPRGAGP